MDKHLLRALAAGAVVVVAGCGGGPVPSVAWVEYVPGLKIEIDAATTAKDCIQLTVYRDFAVDEDILESDPRPTPNTDLIEYIEWSLQEAGCW